MLKVGEINAAIGRAELVTIEVLLSFLAAIAKIQDWQRGVDLRPLPTRSTRPSLHAISNQIQFEPPPPHAEWVNQREQIVLFGVHDCRTEPVVRPLVNQVPSEGFRQNVVNRRTSGCMMYVHREICASAIVYIEHVIERSPPERWELVGGYLRLTIRDFFSTPPRTLDARGTPHEFINSRKASLANLCVKIYRLCRERNWNQGLILVRLDFTPEDARPLPCSFN